VVLSYRTQTETQEIPSEHQEMLFYCEGDQALKQLAQGGCGVSLLGGIQKMTHGPGQPAIGGPAWAGGFGTTTL